MKLRSIHATRRPTAVPGRSSHTSLPFASPRAIFTENYLYQSHVPVRHPPYLLSVCFFICHRRLWPSSAPLVTAEVAVRLATTPQCAAHSRGVDGHRPTTAQHTAAHTLITEGFASTRCGSSRLSLSIIHEVVHVDIRRDCDARRGESASVWPLPHPVPRCLEHDLVGRLRAMHAVCPTPLPAQRSLPAVHP